MANKITIHGGKLQLANDNQGLHALSFPIQKETEKAFLLRTFRGLDKWIPKRALVKTQATHAPVYTFKTWFREKDDVAQLFA